MEEYLKLTPQEFDQDKNGGWRKISDQGLVDYVMSDKKDATKIVEAIDLMDYYVDHYEFAEEDYYAQQLIKFHMGQLYADIGNYKQVIMIFEGLQDEGYNKVGVEYLEFTVAFLQGDKQRCDEIYDQLQQEKYINYETIERMIELWGYSYIEAYSGMRQEELKQWIIENKK